MSSETTKVNGVDLNVDAAVRDRYSQAAQAQEASLCCPVEYDPQFLKVIPQEILDRDYGCGDPSKHLLEGDTVLDLGSGGGKICYIASQVVGAKGKVYGVDCNDEMLSLAKEYQGEVSEKIGYGNTHFLKGRIQDLKLNLELLEEYLQQNLVKTSGDWLKLEEYTEHLRVTKPLIPDNSIDVIVSNCVLNLVRLEDRKQLFQEMFRVLKRGGRIVISDIVSDEVVPAYMKNDPKLWSGCISGSFQETEFLKTCEEVGFYGIEILEREAEPWAVVDGIEFRSLTVRAYKGKDGPCLDRKQAVIYQGPWKSVFDDDGHELIRGERIAVCDKTFNIYSKEPYQSQLTMILPQKDVPLDQAEPFDCHQSPIRSTEETKNNNQSITILPAEDCCGESDCC
jgi:arsenite methyltransferase